MEAHRLLAVDCKRECVKNDFCDDAKALAEQMRKRDEERGRKFSVRAVELREYIGAWHRSGMAVVVKSFDGDVTKAGRWATGIRRCGTLRPGEICTTTRGRVFLVDSEALEYEPGYSESLVDKCAEMPKSGGASVRGWRMPSREEAKRAAKLLQRKAWNGELDGLRATLVRDAVLVWKEA